MPRIRAAYTVQNGRVFSFVYTGWRRAVSVIPNTFTANHTKVRGWWLGALRQSVYTKDDVNRLHEWTARMKRTKVNRGIYEYTFFQRRFIVERISPESPYTGWDLFEEFEQVGKERIWFNDFWTRREAEAYIANICNGTKP